MDFHTTVVLDLEWVTDIRLMDTTHTDMVTIHTDTENMVTEVMVTTHTDTILMAITTHTNITEITTEITLGTPLVVEAGEIQAILQVRIIEDREVLLAAES